MKSELHGGGDSSRPRAAAGLRAPVAATPLVEAEFRAELAAIAAECRALKAEFSDILAMLEILTDELKAASEVAHGR